MTHTAHPILLTAHPLYSEIFQRATTYRKKTATLLRLPHPHELGTTLQTYVRDASGTLRVESTATIGEDHVIARNPLPLTAPWDTSVYNEWLIPAEVVIANYGRDALESLTAQFSPHRKLLTIRAVKLTAALCYQLGGSDTHLMLQLDHGVNMTIVVGDYLTSKGHGISADNMTEYEAL